jgi:hypothetical protein
MVNGIKCYECSLFDVCKAYSKLKPFTEEARVDLGVEITFNDCKHYISNDEDNAENADTSEEEF